MNTRHTALLAAALSAAACAALPAAEPATAQQMADLINQARALGRTCGKTYYPAAPPLKWNPLLEKAAAAHAQDMADKNYFRHESPDGRDMAGRVEQAGYRYRAVGENILAGEPTARAVIDTWLAPPATAKTSWIQPTPKSAWPTPPTSIPNTASIGCRTSARWRGSEKRVGRIGRFSDGLWQQWCEGAGCGEFKRCRSSEKECPKYQRQEFFR